MRYTRDWLIRQIETSEKRIKYLHFWGHTAAHDGTISGACFSQWWAGHPFVEKNITYLTAEHYMMAGKADLFGDTEMRDRILAASSPGAAKEWGRQVRNFDPDVWRTQRCAIVIKGNYLKFSQHPALGAFLLQTRDRVLVEASPKDQIWGIGLEKTHVHAADPSQWRGSNLLGFCLMVVRDQLRESA